MENQSRFVLVYTRTYKYMRRYQSPETDPHMPGNLIDYSSSIAHQWLKINYSINDPGAIGDAYGQK